MGTDVFLFIECKRSNEDEWKLDSRHYLLPQERREFLERCPDDPFAPLPGDIWHVPIARSYKLFEEMAGVRGNVENAVVRPKGMPKDACEVLQREARASEYNFSHT